jgi:hypothetical protein
MILLPVIFNLFVSLLFVGMPISQKPDPCEDAKPGAVAATLFAKDSLFHLALANIKNAYALNKHEHCISFGKDASGKFIASSISNGGATSGKVPAITNAFADLHNHPNNLPPDAGDFYGLLNINKNNPAYKTRFVITLDDNVYALLVTDAAAALSFTEKYPHQPPAYAGGPPGFAVAITDEAREMKYKCNCTDEMVLAFILEKYNTGVSLLKQNNNGVFNKIITTVSKKGSELVYSVGSCE